MKYIAPLNLCVIIKLGGEHGGGGGLGVGGVVSKYPRYLCHFNMAAESNCNGKNGKTRGTQLSYGKRINSCT